MANELPELMRAGRPALGLTVGLTRSGEIVRGASASGHHFVRIDLQHALLDAETVGHIAQTSVGSDIATVVPGAQCRRAGGARTARRRGRGHRLSRSGDRGGGRALCGGGPVPATRPTLVRRRLPAL